MNRAAARAERGAPAARIDLAAVEASLRAVQRNFGRINEQLSAQREPLSDHVIDNLLAGYARVDALVAAGVDILALGRLKHVLELNTTVLCGTDARRREKYRGHIEATERRFYEERDGGVRDLVEWYARHARERVWRRAAGTYVRILSKPQLFIEGNHRTGALVMSYILLSEGQPPFVLSPDNAAAYFDPSTAIRNTRKRSAAMIFRAPAVRARLAQVLRDHAEPRHLLA
jgi:hypothetical protein